MVLQMQAERKRLSLSLLMEESPTKRLPKSYSLMTKGLTTRLRDGIARVKEALRIRESFRSPFRSYFFVSTERDLLSFAEVPGTREYRFSHTGDSF